MRVPAGPTDWSWRTRTRRPRGKSAVDSDVVNAMGGHPVDARSRVDIRADDVPDGINAADHAGGRVVATEGQIYGRQLQQAGDYTGPHRDPPTGTPRPLSDRMRANRNAPRRQSLRTNSSSEAALAQRASLRVKAGAAAIKLDGERGVPPLEVVRRTVRRTVCDRPGSRTDPTFN